MFVTSIQSSAVQFGVGQGLLFDKTEFLPRNPSPRRGGRRLPVGSSRTVVPPPSPASVAVRSSPLTLPPQVPAMISSMVSASTGSLGLTLPVKCLRVNTGRYSKQLNGEGKRHLKVEQADARVLMSSAATAWMSLLGFVLKPPANGRREDVEQARTQIADILNPMKWGEKVRDKRNFGPATKVPMTLLNKEGQLDGGVEAGLRLFLGPWSRPRVTQIIGLLNQIYPLGAKAPRPFDESQLKPVWERYHAFETIRAGAEELSSASLCKGLSLVVGLPDLAVMDLPSIQTTPGTLQDAIDSFRLQNSGEQVSDYAPHGKGNRPRAK